MLTKDDITAMQVASLYAKRSTCISKKVGAVITRNGRIISTGYNGTPSGHPNCCDIFDTKPNNHYEWSIINEIHAEENAILYACKNGVSTNGAYIYITYSPCPSCAKSIIQAGISKVYYLYEYPRATKDWVNFLSRSNIEVINMINSGYVVNPEIDPF